MVARQRKRSENRRRDRALVDCLESRTLLTAASIYDFDFGQGFSGNSISLNQGAGYVGNVLQLTDGGASETRSAFYDTTVPVNAFESSFTIRSSAAAGEGLAFVIQGSGPTAVGGGAGGLGYQGMPGSAAIKFDLANDDGEGGNSTGLYTNGSRPSAAGSVDLTPTGINLHSGDDIDVDITYTGTTLVVKEADAIAGTYATQTYQNQNLTSVIGSKFGYIGFTASTGTITAVQQIARWTYTDNSGMTSAGLNLSGTSIWTDAAKDGRWDIGNSSFDSNGYPTTDAFFYPPSLPAGSYAMQWSGKATPQVAYGAGATITGNVYNSVTNLSTATLTLTQSLSMFSNWELHFVNTYRTSTSAVNTGITKMQIMKPDPVNGGDYAFNSLFIPGAITLAEKFESIRYMDLLQTNGTTEANWSLRNTPSSATQGQDNSRFGAAWEYLVDFANLTNTDMWINIPVMASGSYVTSLANLLKYGSDGTNPYTSPQANPVWAPLNPKLKVYIEWSNEVWNVSNASSYPQNAQNKTLAKAAVANNTAEGQIINYDGVAGTLQSNGYYAGQTTLDNRYVALKIEETSQAFRAVFGDAAMGTQIRPLYEWYYGGYGLYSEGNGYTGMQFLNNYFNNADGIAHVATPHPVDYFIWGGGGGWYDNPTNSSGVGNVNVSNGSFETGTTSWTFAAGTSGTAGVVANGTGIPTAPNGTNAAEISNGGSFSQTLTFTGGYADLYFNSAGDSSGKGTFNVLVDGVAINTTPYQPGTSYNVNGALLTTHTAAYNTGAVGSVHTIEFLSTGTGTVYIDQVGVGTINGIYANISGSNFSGLTVAGDLTDDAQVAHLFGLHVVNYEGGFNIGGDSGGTPLQKLANLDPRAEQAVQYTVNTWIYPLGGEMPMQFNAVGPAYGLTNSLTFLNSPKILGYADVAAESQPAIARGNTIPYAQSANIAITAAGGTAPIDRAWLNVTTAGYYDVAATFNPVNPATVFLAMDGITQNTLTIGSQNSSINDRIWLSAGQHEVLLENISATGGIVNSFTVKVHNSLGSFTSEDDIGGSTKAGSTIYDGAAYTVAGGGSDIAGAADQFNFLDEPWTGNATIIAEVTGVSNTNAFAKAAIMFRNSTATNSMLVAVDATPGNGVIFEYRTSAGAFAGSVTVTTVPDPTPAAPVWLKLSRSGNVFTAFYSLDGSTWNMVGTSQTVNLNSSDLVGLAVTAHNNAALNQSVFTNVSITGNPALASQNGSTLNVTFDSSADPVVITRAGGATTVSSAGVVSSFSTISQLVVTFVAGQNDVIDFNGSSVSPVTFVNGSASDVVNVNAGTLTLASPAPGAGITPTVVGGLNIAAGARGVLASPATHGDRTVLVVSSLSIAGTTGNWTGTLDLSGNDLIVRGGNLGIISNQIASGYASNWTGTGITSLAAASDHTFLTGLGVMEPAAATPFDNQTLGTSDVAIKQTYYGDANLDGQVSSVDYSKIDNGFLMHLTGWQNGDFNYDRVINGSDYTLIDNAFNMQGASLAAEIGPAPAIQIAESVQTVSSATFADSKISIPTTLPDHQKLGDIPQESHATRSVVSLFKPILLIGLQQLYIHKMEQMESNSTGDPFLLQRLFQHGVESV